MYNQRKEQANKILINDEIRAAEVRCMDGDGSNLGVIPTHEAVRRAREQGLDLIEVSGKAKPPVAKIMDYGKFTYELKKKAKETKAKAHTTETKNVQVKIGTGERDKDLKAERIDAWLAEGHRVKVDLFLWGRYKFMEAAFLTERLQRFLEMVIVPFKIADPIKRSPKGYTCVIEVDKKQPLPSPKEIKQKREEMIVMAKKKKKTDKKIEEEKTTAETSTEKK